MTVRGVGALFGAPSLPDGVMVAQATLTRLVMVRIHVGQPSRFVIQIEVPVLHSVQHTEDQRADKVGVQHWVALFVSVAQAASEKRESGVQHLRALHTRPRSGLGRTQLNRDRSDANSTSCRSCESSASAANFRRLKCCSALGEVRSRKKP